MKKINFEISNLNSYYQEYLNTFAPCTDTPPEFILTALLPSLGAVISLKRYIKWGSRSVYPNIWTILLGSSTRMRKTTAVGIGSTFNTLLEESSDEKGFILPNDGSLAGLLQEMITEKYGLLRHSEFSSFISMMNRGFNIGMKQLLTDFFDVPFRHVVRLKKDHYDIPQPILSISSATTLSWFKNSKTATDSTSGFLARFLYCYREEKDSTMPIPAKPDQSRVDNLYKLFTNILNLDFAEITFDKSFEQVYTDCYYQIEAYLKDPFVPESTKTLLARLQCDYFLKLTILECVIAGTTVATSEEATRAAYLVNFYCKHAMLAMENALKTGEASIEEKIITFLMQKGDATSKDLYKLFNNRIKSSLLKSTLNNLISYGEIEFKEVGKSRIYSLTERTTNSEILQFSQLSENA